MLMTALNKNEGVISFNMMDKKLLRIVLINVNW